MGQKEWQERMTYVQSLTYVQSSIAFPGP